MTKNRYTVKTRGFSFEAVDARDACRVLAEYLLKLARDPWLGLGMEDIAGGKGCLTVQRKG